VSLTGYSYLKEMLSIITSSIGYARPILRHAAATIRICMAKR